MPRLYPGQPVVGVGCLVIRDGKILLVRRRYPPSSGTWSIPGGHVGVGETLFDAAVRELEEETGLKGRPLGVANIDEAITVDQTGVRYHYVLVTVLLEAEDGDPKAGGDASDAGFFSFDEARRLRLAPSTEGLLEKIKKGLVCMDRPLVPRRYSPGD